MGGESSLTPGSGFSTRAVHAGQEPDPTTGAVVVPLYQTSTYAQEALGKHKGYEYGRTHNLTRFALERNLAALEGGRHGFCFASGLAATNTLLQTLSSGDHVVAGNNLYGGTYRLFELVLKRFGLEFTFVSTADLDGLDAAFRPNTRMVFLETPTNPMMQLTDIAAGAVPGPFDCWLALRGTKTLAVRMKRHEENAIELARTLAAHPRVRAVFYPGLENHPQHALARRQASGFGGMISFVPGDGSLEAGRRVFDHFRLFTRAESLGGVESLVCHPASMTHASVPREERLRIGFLDGLLRLSVGIEDLDDLRADLDRALETII